MIGLEYLQLRDLFGPGCEANLIERERLAMVECIGMRRDKKTDLSLGGRG
jgi:hypothetical protein